MISSHSNRPIVADLFQVQRGMAGIRFEQSVIFIRQFAYRLREETIALPEAGGGKVLHSSVHRPSR
jgi:RecB family exonuclease